MKPYMVFSRCCGSREGACLVFAHNRQEACKVAWKECYWEITDEWIDVDVRLLKENTDWLFTLSDPAKVDTAHCISVPVSCQQCNKWGDPINHEGCCPDCWDYIQAQRKDNPI